MIAKEDRRSEMFNLLAWMGLLSTEERRIRKFREADDSLYEHLDLTYDDIERVGYLYPHFAVKPSYKGLTEIWIGDHYVNPDSVQWIETVNLLYGVLDDHYDEYLLDVRCFYNPSIVYRYHNIGEDQEYLHVVTIDTEDVRYASIENIEHAVYYISQDQFHIPEVEWVDSTHIRFSAKYTKDIDFFVCTNIANVVEAKAGVGVYLDQPTSNRCYHRMIVDHDSSYPINAKFYPCVSVDKDCVIRVYTDSYHMLLQPDTSRLILYPEFFEVDDPYQTDNEYLTTLPIVDDIITAVDSDDEIEDKFSRISAYCYRMWEKYPWTYLNEQSDFVVCDNSKLRDQAFTTRTVYLYDEVIQKICSNVPYEGYRDVVFYNGLIFSDYIVKNLRKNMEGHYIEDPDGRPTYLIDTSYDISKLTIIKYNTFEDSTFINIGEYINEEQIARLHFKLNRFYRNLLVIRNQFIDEKEYVRIGTEQPDAKDDVMWYELLVNAVPEMFEDHPIDIINLYGLDPNNIPDDVKNGAYMLELDPEDGPASYNKMLMTYFKLSKNKKDYLALQYGEGIDDPRIQEFHTINFGKEEDHEKLNEMVIHDDAVSSTESKYEFGVPEDPGNKDHTAGNIYVQTEIQEPPPGEGNIDIDQISYGPQTPEGDEHTLWIDSTGNDLDGTVKDSLDGVTDSIKFANKIEDVENPDEGDYVVDSIDDTFTEEAEGDATIDELFEDLDFGSDEPGGGSDLDGLMDGISKAVAENIQVDDVANPTVGMIALDDIQYMNEATGRALTPEEVAALPREEKLNSIRKLITDDNTPENAGIGDMWLDYLATLDDDALNSVTYKVLLTCYVWSIHDPERGTLALEADEFQPNDEATLTWGEHLKWVKDKQMIMTPMVYDDEGNIKPDYMQIKENNLKYIMNLTEPDSDTVNEGDIWFQIPAAYLGEIIVDVISHTLMEIGEEMPEGYYLDTGNEVYATMGIDYDAHDHNTEGVGELFQETKAGKLYPIHYGAEIDPVTLNEGDLWYEFLDEIDNRVVYCDAYSMVIRMDERLYLLQFDHDNVQCFAFDDIVLNFKGKLGIRYLTLVADLINAGELSLDDINIFYKRLITFGDNFDPKLTRLYTGRSHVISKPKLDTSDYMITYSTNIGRFRIDYNGTDTTRKEQEAAYRHVIDYTTRDFAYLHGKMMVFVNGKYIPTRDCVEVSANMIQIKNFTEIIATVDIFYSKKDMILMHLKKKAYQYWPIPDDSTFLQRPERDYTKMEYIDITKFTKRGYYDVLMEEYILNGKLLRIATYLEAHPEEREEFIRDMVHKFHAISDIDLSGMKDTESRIVIPATAFDNDAPYQIGYQEIPKDHIWSKP